ncbi:DUF6484 domain-containing protein [Rhodopirellula sp. JC639]|uniref:DUF6484 domain-containing protein n=1 Tax=Stieleria mannarensis TaxID=2755585 RepID=UPI001C726D6D|nr:DUF6484 domain-containing protein [Rhodopirellula sp. JC639]
MSSTSTPSAAATKPLDRERCCETNRPGGHAFGVDKDVKEHRRSSAPLTPTRPPLRPGGVVIGTFLGWDHDQPAVDFPGNPTATALKARSTVPAASFDDGCELALMFENGDWNAPIVIGILQPPPQTDPTTVPLPIIRADASADAGESKAVKVIEVDDQRIVLEADKEIVLRCGKASITMTRAGKILLRGAYLSSRSSGANRIRGGSVQIN